MEGKLKRRFYEPLLLAHALSPTQGDRIGEEMATWTTDSLGHKTSSRRELLRQLCRACDYKKGGSTITAMALEKSPQGPVYWVALKDSNRDKILPFLQQILDTLHTGVGSVSTLRAKVLEQTTNFAAPRIREHCRLLKLELIRAREVLEKKKSLEDHSDMQDLITDLLHDIAEIEPIELCQVLYSKIKGGEVQQLLEVLKMLQPNDGAQEGLWLQHYMGRLASTVRASHILCRMSRDHSYLFENYTVTDIPCGQQWSAPKMTRKFTFDSLASRMLPTQSSDLSGLISDLNKLERTMSPCLTKQLHERYNNPEWKLRVHAELALLEAVHAADIDFYDDDKFIACSKGACFCCYHYICHHPGRFVKPASHNNIWLSWAPPLIPNGGTEGSANQKKLLNKIVDEIRHNAIGQVRSKNGSRRWHPDSTTGVAKTVTDFTLIENYRERSNSTDSVRVQFGLRPESGPETLSPGAQSPLEQTIESDSDEGGVLVDLVSAQVSEWRL